MLFFITPYGNAVARSTQLDTLTAREVCIDVLFRCCTVAGLGAIQKTSFIELNALAYIGDPAHQ